MHLEVLVHVSESEVLSAFPVTHLSLLPFQVLRNIFITCEWKVQSAVVLKLVKQNSSSIVLFLWPRCVFRKQKWNKINLITSPTYFVPPWQPAAHSAVPFLLSASLFLLLFSRFISYSCLFSKWSLLHYSWVTRPAFSEAEWKCLSAHQISYSTWQRSPTPTNTFIAWTLLEAEADGLLQEHLLPSRW